MVRTKDGDGIKSNLIVQEVQKRPCLFDTNDVYYSDRLRKERSWDEVCECVVPGWELMRQFQKLEAGKKVTVEWTYVYHWIWAPPTRLFVGSSDTHIELLLTILRNYSTRPSGVIHYVNRDAVSTLESVCSNVREVQKRWRSIRDSYTKAYRQGKCVLPEQCLPGSRRYQYHAQMSFLLRALQNKKPRYSQDKINANSTPVEQTTEKYESFSEVSNSPQHSPPEDLPKIIEPEKPIDLKKPEDKPETVDKCNQAAISHDKPIEINNPSVEIKIDANSILPDDYFDDDRMFMNSLLPLFKKMSDDTRLLCRIEVLKIIRYLLRGEGRGETGPGMVVPKADVCGKDEVVTTASNVKSNRLAVTTRSAGGTRPQRKRKTRSPSPLPFPAKRRGPGRPRKVRPPPSDSDEEQAVRRRPKLQVPSPEPEDSLSHATSVSQLTQPLFMKMYNLERCKAAQDPPQSVQVSIKTEPVEDPPSS